MNCRTSIKLKKLIPIDIDNCADISDVLSYMSQASFGGRSVGKAFSILRNIVDDPDCALILTVSGAMTVAKLGRIFGSLISKSIVKVVITTGAIVTHSLVEELGMHHHKAPSNLSDEELCVRKLNRIYDSIEPESNLEKLEELAHHVFSSMDATSEYASFEIIRTLASSMLKPGGSTGFLRSVLERDINAYVPAFTDSELGLYLFRYNEALCSTQMKKLVYDPMRDLAEYANWIRSKKRIAFLTIGGGVPRNWGQQMIPFLRSQSERDKLPCKTVLPEVVAAVRICPDQESLGHLSGSTYSEGITWGKFLPSHKENFVEIKCDATIIFPLLAKVLIDYVDEARK
ncbi:MAG: deoxyhypusine synthase family protein [Phycisphaerae bacterium]|nr:deoxyhypusine synthase family protein [Phycisphaerae bacterium]